jgi:ATPase family associated with various cellular activities (AAA)
VPSLPNYGPAIAATTAALSQLLTTATTQVTARTPDVARAGVLGASVNLFLYRDELIAYRDGSDPTGVARSLVELHYLVSSHAADEPDANALSQRAHGAARAAIETNPVIEVSVGSGGPMQVRLTTTSLTIHESTSLWIASRTPLRLSFGVIASFGLNPDDRLPLTTDVHDVVMRATAGLLVVFRGIDAAARASAAATVAAELGQPVLQVGLDEVVSKYIGETEKNLATLFNRAEAKAFVLFFDEADALFGRRSSEPEGHDAYVGVEVGPILDLLAAAPGVVVIGLRDAVGEDLASRAAIEVRFPPDDD